MLEKSAFLSLSLLALSLLSSYLKCRITVYPNNYLRAAEVESDQEAGSVYFHVGHWRRTLSLSLLSPVLLNNELKYPEVSDYDSELLRSSQKRQPGAFISMWEVGDEHVSFSVSRLDLVWPSGAYLLDTRGLKSIPNKTLTEVNVLQWFEKFVSVQQIDVQLV